MHFDVWVNVILFWSFSLTNVMDGYNFYAMQVSLLCEIFIICLMYGILHHDIACALNYMKILNHFRSLDLLHVLFIGKEKVNVPRGCL